MHKDHKDNKCFLTFLPVRHVEPYGMPAHPIFQRLPVVHVLESIVAAGNTEEDARYGVVERVKASGRKEEKKCTHFRLEL